MEADLLDASSSEEQETFEVTVTLEPVIEVAEELLGVTELGVADDSVMVGG